MLNDSICAQRVMLILALTGSMWLYFACIDVQAVATFKAVTAITAKHNVAKLQTNNLVPYLACGHADPFLRTLAVTCMTTGKVQGSCQLQTHTSRAEHVMTCVNSISCG